MSRNEPTPPHKRILDTSDGHLRRASDWRELVNRATPGGFETDHEHEQFMFRTLQQITAETQATQMKLIHERAVNEQATVTEALDVLHETVKPVHVELPDRPEFDRPGLSDYVDYMGPVIEPKLRISGLHARAKRELALRTPSDAKLIAEPSEEQVEQFAP
jgi:hypothetical protein